jgi:hypothetical protein
MLNPLETEGDLCLFLRLVFIYYSKITSLTYDYFHSISRVLPSAIAMHPFRSWRRNYSLTSISVKFILIAVVFQQLEECSFGELLFG